MKLTEAQPTQEETCISGGTLHYTLCEHVR